MTGATTTAKSVSSSAPGQQAGRAAEKAAAGGQHLQQREQARRQQQRGRHRQQRDGGPGPRARDPQDRRGGARRRQQHVERARQQQQEPGDGREIAGRPEQEVQPVEQVEAGHRQQPQVLQAALAPAPVAAGVVHDVAGRLLVAPVRERQQVDVPAGAPHQRRLHEVVAQDGAAERRAARQHRQAAMRAERRDADDGVVAPVVGRVGLPPRLPRRQQRAVQAAGKLDETAEQRRPPRRQRHGLDQAGLRVHLHRAHQRQQRRAGHDAVGVEHHHAVVTRAPAPAEVGNVARLAAAVGGAAAVVHPGGASNPAAERGPGGLLGRGDRRVGRIAQQVQIEAAAVAGALQRAEHRGQAGGDARGIFVVDRHHQRGARRGGIDLRRRSGLRRRS